MKQGGKRVRYATARAEQAADEVDRTRRIEREAVRREDVKHCARCGGARQA